MRHLSNYSVFKAALPWLFTVFAIRSTAFGCSFSDNSCIDGIAQVSVSFQFPSISPSPLLFYYAFDGGYSYPNGSSLIKVGYWLQYDQNQLTAYNKHFTGTNWMTEAALRIGNLGGYVGGSNNGCDGVWGNACSENLKNFLQSAIFDLSRSGLPYELPLQTVLQPLTDDTPGPSIQGCPATLFQLNNIPSYGIVFPSLLSLAQRQRLMVLLAVINQTSVGGNNQSDCNVNVSPSGNTGSVWRTWNISNVTPLQQAQEVAVGIITRGPVYGSKPLASPQDINIELVCSRAPKQGHRPGGAMSGDRSIQGFARGMIKTYAFDDDFDYEDEVDDDNDSDSDDELEAGGYAECLEEEET
jgi:hypothetical protein